jgi:hypothetical protein
LRIRRLVCLFAVCFSFQAHATEFLKSPAEARQLTDRVMSKLAAGELEAGLRVMQPYLIVPPAEFETMLGQAKLQNPMAAQRFGSRQGVEFVREERVGESVLRIIQIQKYERHPTRWVFYFYRTNSGWVLNTFHFDDNIRALFPGGG